MANRYLIDTSVFLRFFAELDLGHEAIAQAVDRVLRDGDELLYTPQVVRESWSVLTRPLNVGGYGRTPEFAATIIDRAKSAFTFADDTPAIYPIWLDLVRNQGVSGRQVHDAYHVAEMIAHGLSHILTIDARDFARYQQVTVVRPDLVP